MTSCLHSWTMKVPIIGSETGVSKEKSRVASLFSSKLFKFLFAGRNSISKYQRFTGNYQSCNTDINSF